MAATDRVSSVIVDPPDPAELSGALVVLLPDDGYVAWLRPETRSSVDWGGDPHNKAIAIEEESGEVRPVAA